MVGRAVLPLPFINLDSTWKAAARRASLEEASHDSGWSVALFVVVNGHSPRFCRSALAACTLQACAEHAESRLRPRFSAACGHPELETRRPSWEDIPLVTKPRARHICSGKAVQTTGARCSFDVSEAPEDSPGGLLKMALSLPHSLADVSLAAACLTVPPSCGF